jgi:hypothetical protein
VRTSRQATAPATTNLGVRDYLRSFDFNSAYGPCLGISRMQRWQRAHAAGLNPPTAVHALLLAGAGDDDLQRAELDKPRHAMR